MIRRHRARSVADGWPWGAALAAALLGVTPGGASAGQAPGGPSPREQPAPHSGVSMPMPLLPPRGIPVPLDPGGESPLPSGWSVKVFEGKADVSVERTGDRYAARLVSEKASFALHREVSVDIAEYPYLSWAWRVDRLPPRGDARRPELDDQAAQVYVVFPGFPAPFQIVGYIWDSTAPPGSLLSSSKNPLVKLIVLRSGAAHLGEWVWECRNVLEDFRRLFREDPTEVMRVALLINSQNTRSSAASRFASLFFSRDPIQGFTAGTAAAASARPR